MFFRLINRLAWLLACIGICVIGAASLAAKDLQNQTARMATKFCFEPIKGKNASLAHQACMVYRRLAKQMTAAKAKGGELLFAQYLPTPRIGDFSNDQAKDAQTLKRDRAKPKAIDRPIDWQKAPMPFQDELAFHHAYTDLLKLAACQDAPFAYGLVGQLFDQGVYVSNDAILYGLFKRAEHLDHGGTAMKNRLYKIHGGLSAIDRVQFRRSFTEYQWGKHPKMKPLFALCAKP